MVLLSLPEGLGIGVLAIAIVLSRLNRNNEEERKGG